jgi:hypothetical protein
MRPAPCHTMATVTTADSPALPLPLPTGSSSPFKGRAGLYKRCVLAETGEAGGKQQRLPQKRPAACAPGDMAAARRVPRLRRELLRGRYRWEGASCCQTVSYIVRNQHPIVSMFCASARHPYTRGERVLVFVSLLAVRALVSFAILGAFVSSIPRDRAKNVGEQVILEASIAGLSVGVAVFMSLMTSLFTCCVTLDESCCFADYDEGHCKRCVNIGGRSFVAGLGLVCGAVFGLLMGIAPKAVDIFAPIAITFGISLAHSDTWLWSVLTCCTYCCVARRDRLRDQERFKAGKEVPHYDVLLRYLGGEDIDAETPTPTPTSDSKPAGTSVVSNHVLAAQSA